jgi:protocatechuate 3,4-dioxygenase, alpha subunit
VSNRPGRLSCLPSQTVGPFFHFGLTANKALGCIPEPRAQGERIRLHLRLFEGDDVPVPDAIIELWQADACGRYNHPADPRSGSADPAFCGFGRLDTDADGSCTFRTVLPGRVPDGRGGLQSPHINVSIFARGLLGRLCTRIYFEGDSSLPGGALCLLAGTVTAAIGLWTFTSRAIAKPFSSISRKRAHCRRD